MTPPSTIIVGGGIAGLAVAYELQRLGVPFRLLERAPRPGGVILSEQIDGYTIDGGPDALLIQKPDAIRLCEELGLGSRLVPTRPPRTAYIQRNGRLHRLPPGSMLGFPTEFMPTIVSCPVAGSSPRRAMREGGEARPVANARWRLAIAQP